MGCTLIQVLQDEVVEAFGTVAVLILSRIEVAFGVGKEDISLVWPSGEA